MNNLNLKLEIFDICGNVTYSSSYKYLKAALTKLKEINKEIWFEKDEIAGKKVFFGWTGSKEFATHRNQHNIAIITEL